MKISVLLVCIVGALPCLGAEPLAPLLACRSITDSEARLACFDRETAALSISPPTATTAAPAGVPPAASSSAGANATAPPTVAAAPPLDARQSFGLSGSAIAAHEEAAGARPAKVAKIEARVVGLSLTGNGRTVFTFDNSQMWRQIESDGDMLARLGDTATISRGLLGSYWLQLKSGRGCKVTRIR